MVCLLSSYRKALHICRWTYFDKIPTERSTGEHDWMGHIPFSNMQKLYFSNISYSTLYGTLQLLWILVTGCRSFLYIKLIFLLQFKIHKVVATSFGENVQNDQISSFNLKLLKTIFSSYIMLNSFFKRYKFKHLIF